MEFTIIEGDTIRAYDFKPMVGREDCYVEGEVLDICDTTQGYQAYKICVTADKFDAKIDRFGGPDNRVEHVVFVPWRTDRDYQGRVINLSR